MIKKSFFGFRAPRLNYLTVSESVSEPVEVPLPEKMTLMVPVSAEQAALVGKKKTLIKKGDAVTKGQLIAVFDGSPDRVLCSASGTVSAIDTVTGIYSHRFLTIAVDVDESGEPQPEGESVESASDSEPGIWSLIKMLPGLPSPDIYRTSVDSFHTLVVSGADTDLFMMSNQYSVVKQNTDLLAGIEYLRKKASDKDLVLVVPEYLKARVEKSGLPVHCTGGCYPSSNRRLVEKALVKKGSEEPGYLFLSAEAIAGLGKAARTETFPVNKLITVTGKDGRSVLVSARVGTPLREVLKAAGSELVPEDHIIYGGPFTGTSVYSGDIPVMSDTDALILEGQEDMPRITDTYCINCGECVRSCPVNIPVNLLIRLLETGSYDEANENYGLDACVECGMCSFVCPAKMPLFQQIKLARKTISELKKDK